MGEKANVTSEELAAAAGAAGGMGAHAASVGGVVRDTVVGRGVDAVLDRKKDDEKNDDGEEPDTPRSL
jgi:hypothetical protein